MTPVKVQCYRDIVVPLIGWSLHSWSYGCQMDDDRAVRIKSHDLFTFYFIRNSAVTYNMFIVVLLCNGAASYQMSNVYSERTNAMVRDYGMGNKAPG